MRGPAETGVGTVWLFDLDNTLHDASHAAFRFINEGMSGYMVEHLGTSPEQADALRTRYLQRYGATLLGLVRHHGVDGRHFLRETHLLPGLEERVRTHPHDLAVLRRLPGRKFILTNAPREYTERVLGALDMCRLFDGVLSIEDMRMFGHWRPKPDTRMLRVVAARLGVPPSACVLVEDTLGHQKAARRVGMGTVWMQRWTRRATWGLSTGARVHRRPAYVDLNVRGLRDLLRGGLQRG